MVGRSIGRMGCLIAASGILGWENSACLAKAVTTSTLTQQTPSGLIAQPLELARPILLAQDLSRPTLRSGSVGDAVSELQALLQLLGYYDGPIDGFYREVTQAAVGRFQTAVGIPSDGIAGPTTWQKLLPNPGEVPTASIPEPTAPVAAGVTPEPAIIAESPPSITNPAANPPTTPTAPDPDPTASSQPVAVNLPVLRQGMFGPAVTRLQERLATLGVYGGAVDGIFGPQTVAAVEQIQRQHNLTVDGIVGPVTWSIIFK
jgi:N-acetylmuramoyl-L-alanine amidase